jgi:hypothetical protein
MKPIEMGGTLSSLILELPVGVKPHFVPHGQQSTCDLGKAGPRGADWTHTPQCAPLSVGAVLLRTESNGAARTRFRRLADPRSFPHDKPTRLRHGAGCLATP